MPTHRRPNADRAALTIVLALVALLAACDASPKPSAPPDFEYSLSVDVAPGASRAETEAHYGGKVVVWHPEAGFALLGLNRPGGLETLNVVGNKNVFRVPELRAASAEHAPDGGEGRSAWSGGRSAWSGGQLTWSSKRTTEENARYRDQVGLPGAQALAPHLGAGVRVAVVDTGIDLAHPAFAGKLAPPDVWRDFVDGDVYPQEVPGPNYGHGTGVADLVLQLAPNATLLPLRALGPDGSGDTTAVVAAIDYAVAWGADIVNLSLGTDTGDSSLKRLVTYAAQRGVLVVASAGNSGREAVTFPAGYKKEVLGVGSVNYRDELSSFSAYGKKLSLTAPGEFLYTAAPDETAAVWSGTSFAAPFVTGAAALALGEQFPRSSLTPHDLARQLKATAQDVHEQGRNIAYGADQLGKGRLDTAAFLRAALPK